MIDNTFIVEKSFKECTLHCGHLSKTQTIKLGSPGPKKSFKYEYLMFIKLETFRHVKSFFLYLTSSHFSP